MLAVGLHYTAPRPASLGQPPPPLAALPDLPAWYAPPARPGAGAVLLLHGAWENRRRMLARAEHLQRGGYGVLLLDLPAHGESPGARITFGAREAAGAAAALAWLRDRLPGERVGAIAVSLGGAAALLGPQPLAVDALVLESVYPTIESALHHRLAIRLGDGPAALLVPVFTAVLSPILGVSPTDLRPIERIGAVTAPLLILSGAEDARTPPAEAAALAARARAPLHLLPGAGHVDLERHDPAAYWRIVEPFLTAHLRAR